MLLEPGVVCFGKIIPYLLSTPANAVCAILNPPMWSGRWNGTESNGLVGRDGLTPEIAGGGFLRERERERGRERGERGREGEREGGRGRDRGREREKEREKEQKNISTCISFTWYMHILRS